MISQSQIDTIKKIFIKQSEYNDLDLFCKSITNKLLCELDHGDVNKIIECSEITKNMKMYLLEIFDYLEYNKEELIYKKLTYKEFKAILKKFKEDYPDIFFPMNLNLKYLRYKTLSSNDDFKILDQYNIKTNNTINLISFKNVLICDWDDVSLEYILSILENEMYSFYIYKTFKGYHGYCTSEYFDHTKFSTFQLMNRLGCDPWYISFTKLNGFVSRLSKKPDRYEEFIERFVMDYNPKCGSIKSKKDIIKLINIKDSLVGC
jgi:hypothetical protein